MKTQITRKEARTLGLLGLHDAQNLLRPFDAVHYTAWIYGRNEDLYYIAWQRFTTWYRPTAYKFLDYDYVKDYDDKAKEIMEDRELNREQRRELVYNLIVEMLENA